MAWQRFMANMLDCLHLVYSSGQCPLLRGEPDGGEEGRRRHHGDAADAVEHSAQVAADKEDGAVVEECPATAEEST